ncbi:hypothetical protein PQC61_gp09 [Gordonia phage Emperor]|uniref:Uncharacterized protein n=2 Tax=root TaxID=1 RepID=A0A2Z4Q4B5_9CAUD|nr:hypothetical protein [Gordonia westfalica]YP_010674606.1 hypothetical protein PQC61_gp09 [Gordonia phage Emperor]AWY04755.1 hypothetical protein PBI_EMPEROR_9 [Gordonia phage Emperor]SDU50458.1 hypothetical protein SAMN04488548_1341654 [Gordonia westfalica]
MIVAALIVAAIALAVATAALILAGLAIAAAAALDDLIPNPLDAQESTDHDRT